MEITSWLSRRLQLIIGEFSGGSQRPRVISAEEQEGRAVVTSTVYLLWCLFNNTKGCLRFWIASGPGEQYWKRPLPGWWRWIIVTERTAVYNDMIGPRAQERVTPEGTAGCCSFFVSLSVDIGETRVGKHFLEGGGWECVILIVTPPYFSRSNDKKRPIFCQSVFFSQAWEGCIHSHWVLIMCQTIMSQSLASHVRKLALPPLPCYSMQMERKKKKKAEVWELDLMEQSQATVLS